MAAGALEMRAARRRLGGPAVYAVYFIFSWNQPDDALNRVASGPWAPLIRRPLMPAWLYCRGLLVMLMGAARPTYLFGHAYAHGVPYYFPVVFALKSTLGFLLLLLLAAAAGVVCRKPGTGVIPEPVRPHWRVRGRVLSFSRSVSWPGWISASGILCCRLCC